MFLHVKKKKRQVDLKRTIEFTVVEWHLAMATVMNFRQP